MTAEIIGDGCSDPRSLLSPPRSPPLEIRRAVSTIVLTPVSPTTIAAPQAPESGLRVLDRELVE
jgi:hypothetical protein